MSEPAPRPDAVLVDGYNLLHAIPRFAPRGAALAPARAALERWLYEAAARLGVGEVVVVWDGSAEAPPTSAAGRRGPLRTFFTSPGETADQRLLSLCRGPYADRATRTWVVSSDRDVQAPARELGFGALGAMTFFQRWSGARPRGGCAREAEREAGSGRADHETDEKPRPTRREVDEIFEQFLSEHMRPLEEDER